ncbi:MAG: hypothetical protein DI537_41160 [Stutzerimonas stutzeri]|nr:MAG: hypothetical protein DI537_41160 [Stutzerimonas stutzeri]
MDAAILHIRWLGKAPQRFVFGTVDDAVQSAHVICARFGAAPEGLDWQEKLAKGEIVRSSAFTMEVQTTEFHSDALTTDEPLPDPNAPPAHDPLFMYVLMRRDVPQYLTGRAAAQSNHAGTAFVIRAYKKKNPEVLAMIDEWEQEGDGFGTTIVKSVTAAEMRQAVSLATLMGVYAEVVHDPEYFIKDGENVHFIPVDTCAFVFGRRSVCDAMLRRFPLLKEDHE